MQTNKLSQEETGIYFKIGSDVIKKWSRIYTEKGFAALHEEPRGIKKAAFYNYVGKYKQQSGIHQKNNYCKK